MSGNRRFLPFVALAATLAALFLVGCPEEREPLEPHRTQAQTPSYVREPNFFQSLAESGGRAIIGLKERDAPGGVSVTGRLPRQAAVAAQMAVLTDFPELNLLQGVERVGEAQTTAGPSRVDFHVPFIVVDLPADAQLLSAIESHPNVEYVTPDDENGIAVSEHRGIATFSAQFPSDSLPWGVDSVRAPDAWHIVSGKESRIGLVDTGMDIDYIKTPQWHPDFTPLPGQVGVFKSFTDSLVHESDGACVDPDFDGACYFEEFLHGSALLGLSIGLQNDKGIIGVADSAAYYVAKVTYTNNAGTQIVRESDYAAGVYWVNGAAWIEDWDPGSVKVGATGLAYTSQDTLQYRALHGAFKEAANQDRLLWLAGAGEAHINPGVLIPGFFREVVAVGAVNEDLSRRESSPTGPELELVAPGAPMCVSWNREAIAPPLLPNGMKCDFGGTSAAVPIAAGVALLMADYNSSWRSARLLRERLQRAARDLGSTGRDNIYGYGMVDAVCAVLNSSTCTGTELLPGSAADLLNPPTALGCDDNLAPEVPCQWTNGTGTVAIQVYRNGALVAALAPGTSSWTDTNVSFGSTYDYAVRHYDSATGQFSPWSDDDLQVVAKTPPSGLSCGQAFGETAVMCLWSNGELSDTTEIQRKVGSGRSWTFLAKVQPGSSTFTDNGVQDGNQYWYRARHRRGATTTSWSAADSASVSSGGGGPCCD